MASSKVYVGGLPWRCSADDLRQVCSKFGVVEDGMCSVPFLFANEHFIKVTKQYLLIWL